jgi:outer membrane receptor for ferrienterochelin and colicin
MKNNYLYGILLGFSIISFAQDVEDVIETQIEQAEQSEAVEEVVTTGSRIARSALDMAQPVTIISGDEFKIRGYTNAAEALTDLPEVSSVNSLSGDQGSQGAGQQVASNFGLNSARTVTLVNGRRFVGSQSPTGGAGSGLAVDLNNIPSALIDRIEIVPVGGAAVYGADAIAGVVNYILKDDFEGAEFNLNQSSYGGMEDDLSFNLTIGGNFADGRGNIVFNAQVEEKGQVFYDQANSRIQNCTDGFFYKNPNDQSQDIFATLGHYYPKTLESTRGASLQNADGQRAYGDLNGDMCQHLVSNPVEGLLTAYGDNEVGAVGYAGNGNLNYSSSAPLWYIFGAPGDLTPMDAGIPYTTNYYTRGSSIYNIQDNKILRAGFERKNISVMLTYDITENHQLFMDVYNNNYYAEDDGSSSSAHYSDYWFGYVDRDNCNAGGYVTAWGGATYNGDGTGTAANCWTLSGSIPIYTDDPFLTANSVAIMEGLGYSSTTPAYLQKLHVDLSPSLRGDGFNNESTTQFYSTGMTGNFDVADRNFNYELGYSWGQTRVLGTAPFVVGARFAAAMDYDINPTTGEIDCRFNYDETYKLPATPAFGYDASYGSYLAGGIGLGTVGDCSPYNVMGFNNPGNEDAKEYFTSFANDGSQLNQRSVFGSITGEAYELPAGPIEFVLGFDRRKETARYDADQFALLSVAIRGSQTRSTSGQFEIESEYIELSIPLLSDMPFAQDVRVDYGYRELENTNTLRTNAYDVDALSLFWRITDEVAIRASEQTTTKSPNIADLYGPKNPSFQQALDPCDTRYVGDGDFPSNRLANCTAAGIDTTDFTSFVAGGTVQGVSGGNPRLLDEAGETKSFGVVYTPNNDFLAPYGNFTFSADYIEILLTDYVTTFSLIDFMEACYDAASYPNNFCGSFTRSVDGQVNSFEVGAGNSGVIDFATYIYKANWDKDTEYGNFSVAWRGMQQDKRNQADSGDPADLVDKTGWASDPEWTHDLTIAWAYDNYYTYYKMDFVDGGYINKQQSDLRADRYIGANGQPITQYDGYFMDTIGFNWAPRENVTFTARVNNPLDHDGSESRYQTERSLAFIGRSVTTSLVVKF